MLEADEASEESKEVIIYINSCEIEPSGPSKPKGHARPSGGESPLTPTSESRAYEEVSRILSVQSNFYAVLQVNKQSSASEVRNSFLKNSRLVHPDKCRDPRAHQAAAVVNRAYETLKNPVKKALYDRFVADYQKGTPKQGMSYDEWEASVGRQQVMLPLWMQQVLACPGGSVCLLLVMLTLLPAGLLLLLLLGAALLLFMPIKLGVRLWHHLTARRHTRGFVGVRLQLPTQPSSKSAEQELLPMPHWNTVVTSSSVRQPAVVSPRKQSSSGALAGQDSAESV